MSKLPSRRAVQWAIDEFAKASVEHSWMGTMPPEDKPIVQERYEAAYDRTQGHLNKLFPRKLGVTREVK